MKRDDNKVGEEDALHTKVDVLLKACRAGLEMLSLAVDTNGGDSKTHVGCEQLRQAIQKAVS